jgi:hypothetical protein
VRFRALHRAFNQAQTEPLKRSGLGISTRWNSYDIHIVALNFGRTHTGVINVLKTSVVGSFAPRNPAIDWPKPGSKSAYEGAKAIKQAQR